MAIAPDTIKEIEAHFDEMIEMQRAKLMKMATQRVPNITSDDLLTPHDFPALAADPNFNYEDGVLGGLIQSQISLRARFFRSGDGLAADEKKG